MKRAAIYARVSTKDQTQGTSPDEQLKRGRAYAAQLGYQVVDEELDVISGTFVLARSTFNRYLEMMSTGKLDVVVVDIPDRLGRGDAIAKCELLAELSGGKIEYATPGRDDTTIEGMALKATETLVSGIERINTRRRTMSGKKALATQGRVIASPYRPYGYRFDKHYDPATGRKIGCDLEPVEDEASIVVRVYEWCAYEGLTTHAIAKKLTGMGEPTLSDKDGLKKRKVGAPGQWHKDTVHGILTNATYKGEWRYRKNKIRKIDTPDGVKSRVEKRDPSEVIPVPVPAIVSGELWQLAQERLKRNAKRNFKPTKYRYLLRGRFRCAKCGGTMCGCTRVSKNKKGESINWHYRCAKKYQFGRSSPNACDSRNVNGPVVEGHVWARLVDLLLDEEALFQEISRQREETERTRETIKATMASMMGKNHDELTGLDRLLDLYTDGGIPKDTYLANKRRIERRIRVRETEVTELQQHIEEATPLAPDREAELRRLRAALADRLEGASFEQKSQLLELLRVECFYHDETGHVLMTGVFGSHTVMPDCDEKERFSLSATSEYCRYTRAYGPGEYRRWLRVRREL